MRDWLWQKKRILSTKYSTKSKEAVCDSKNKIVLGQGLVGSMRTGYRKTHLPLSSQSESPAPSRRGSWARKLLMMRRMRKMRLQWSGNVEDLARLQWNGNVEDLERVQWNGDAEDLARLQLRGEDLGRSRRIMIMMWWRGVLEDLVRSISMKRWPALAVVKIYPSIRIKNDD